MDDETTDETPKKPAKAEPKPTLLVYSGPSDELIFEGVRFLRGIPIEAPVGLAEKLRVHSLFSEGHTLYVVA